MTTVHTRFEKDWTRVGVSTNRNRSDPAQQSQQSGKVALFPRPVDRTEKVPSG